MTFWRYTFLLTCLLFGAALTSRAQTCTRPPCTNGVCPQIIVCPCQDVVTNSPLARLQGVQANACTNPPSDPCYFGYTSTTSGSQINVTQAIPDALVYTTDFFYVGELYGSALLVGQAGLSSVVTTYTPLPYCTQVGDTFALTSSASGEADSNLYQGTYTFPLNGQTVSLPLLAWDHLFYDTGDRSFLYSLYQYPFFFVNPYVVVGVDARDGSVFQVFGNGTQIIDDDITYVDDCIYFGQCGGGGGPI